MTGAKYGGQHQAIRRAMEPYVAGSRCSRCGRVIRPGEPWHLDHDDDTGGYAGPAHAHCNVVAGGKLGQARQRARRERVTRMSTDCVLGLEISEDRRHTSIAAAGWVDGAVMVDLVAYLDGTEAVPEVLRLRAERTVSAVCVDPHSAAATLIRPLTDVGVMVTELSTSDVVVAHGMFLDELAAGRLRHTGSPELTAAVRHAMQRPLGGAQTWQRRNLSVDASPLTAATWAVWAVLTNGDYDLLESVW